MGNDSKRAFTPGPWHFDGVCQIVEAERPHMRVAFLPSDHEEYASSPSNGRLIAAAPEMYEALKALELQALQSDVNNPSNEWGREALSLARAALKTAGGK